MASSRFGADLRSLLINLLSSAIFGSLLLLVPPLRERLDLYSRPALIGVAVLALAIPAAQYVVAKRWGKPVRLLDPWAAFGLVLLAFVVTTISVRSSVPNDAYLAIPVAVLLVAEAWFFIGLSRGAKAVSAASDPVNALGFAATSVLVHVKPDGRKVFVLVRNLNINRPHGLWVSPGGHFDPDVDDPTVVVKKKIETETGFVSRIVSTPGLEGAEKQVDLSTAETRWIARPDFLLDEELGGSCRMGHERHLDFIYICQTDGESVPGIEPKYTGGDRIEIELTRCVASEEAAVHAVDAAVAEWHRVHDGKARGRRASTSQDVAQRLHLTARFYQPTEA